jgi:hypothetical protein
MMTTINGGELMEIKTGNLMRTVIWKNAMPVLTI